MRMGNDMLTPPGYALDLYPNKALLFDPKAIGQVLWPNDARLPADLNLELTDFFYRLLGEDEFAPANQTLHSLFYLTGVLSFNLSFYNLAQNPVEGFFRDRTQPLVTIGEGARIQASDSHLKDYIATKCQKILLCAAQMLGRKPKLTMLVNSSVYSPDKFGKITRLRRPQAMLSVEHSKVTPEEAESVQKLVDVVQQKIVDLAGHHKISLDTETTEQIKAYIGGEINRTYGDLKAVQSFFGSSVFTFFERSLTPYLQSLISTVCRRNGGQAYSTYHGVCQTASEPDVATMVNASTFWGITDGFTDDARELSEKIPAAIRHFEIGNLGQEEHYTRFLKNDRPRDRIKRVAIMGRHVVMRTSAFNTLEFPAYLDIERKMSSLLVEQGYEVTYKAHPESSWRHFDSYFDPRIKIDWRPFEPVMDEFDALYYHFGASSTLPHALGSHLHIFMLQDGWHDIRIWPNRIQKHYQQYCNMLPGVISDSGLIEFDKEEILKAFENPKVFNKEDRIRDFFSKRY